MSVREIELCSHLLKDNYGESVGVVGKYLMSQICPRPLTVICRDVSLPRVVVNTALRFLLQHNLATFSTSNRGCAEYALKSESVMHLLYCQQYVYHMKVDFGDVAELITEEFLSHGRLIMSKAIKQVGEKLMEANEAEYTPEKLSVIRDEFQKMVKLKFLCRAAVPDQGKKKRIPSLVVNESDSYSVPQIQLHLLEKPESCDQPSTKRLKSQSEYPDAGIYWRLDPDRIFRYLRDQAIISAVSSAVDKKCGEIVKSMLNVAESKYVARHQLWSSTTASISHGEILTTLKGCVTEREFDQYLKILCEDKRCFISKADDRSGGMYVVNIKKIISHLAEEISASVVQERFGSKACRIFRLLLQKKYLEQKQLEELSMISPKEAKEFTYRMMKECFVITQEISKTTDYAAGRTFFLFHVDINQVCRMLLENSYKAATNCLIYLESFKRDQKRLLDKKFRLDAIVATLEQSGASAEEIEEVNQMITPSEKVMLEKTMNVFDKLNRSVTQLAEHVLILKTHLYLTTIA